MPRNRPSVSSWSIRSSVRPLRLLDRLNGITLGDLFAIIRGHRADGIVTGKARATSAKLQPSACARSSRGQRYQVREEWSDELNRGLILLHVRAVSPDHDAERFAFASPGALEPAEDRFGEGFFDSVSSTSFVRGRSLEDSIRCSPVFTSLRASRSRPQYRECRELIVSAIKGRAQELMRQSATRSPRQKESSARLRYVPGRSILDLGSPVLGFG